MSPIEFGVGDRLKESVDGIVVALSVVITVDMLLESPVDKVPTSVLLLALELPDSLEDVISLLTVVAWVLSGIGADSVFNASEPECVDSPSAYTAKGEIIIERASHKDITNLVSLLNFMTTPLDIN
jgi:hypothetical protein